MKKWALLCLIAILTIVLGACGSGTDTVTLELEQDGIYSEVIYTHTGDDKKVSKQSTKNVIDYEALGLSSKEEAEEALNEMVGQYKGVDGLEHTITFDDDTLTEELIVDYEKADIDEISELPGSNFEGDYEDGIYLDASVKALEAQGFEVVD